MVACAQRAVILDGYDSHMVRFVIIGIVIATAFTLYALVDAAMTDGSRARGVSKPVWVVLVVVLPVIGGVLWFMIGKGDTPPRRPTPPDDDPRFAGTRMTSGDLDVHMKDLEDRLRELDEETFPGEVSGSANTAETTGNGTTSPGTAAAEPGVESAADSAPQASGAPGNDGAPGAGPDSSDSGPRDLGKRTDGDAAQQ